MIIKVNLKSGLLIDDIGFDCPRNSKDKVKSVDYHQQHGSHDN